MYNSITVGVTVLKNALPECLSRGTACGTVCAAGDIICTEGDTVCTEIVTICTKDDIICMEGSSKSTAQRKQM